MLYLPNSKVRIWNNFSAGEYLLPCNLTHCLIVFSKKIEGCVGGLSYIQKNILMPVTLI
jgi:hypothetical protein